MLPQSLRNVETQLRTMNVNMYEIGVRIPKELTGEKFDTMMLRNRNGLGLSAADVLDPKFLGWLSAQNAKGHHIYIRPYGPSQLSLIDDLDAGNLQRLIDTGFTPACVIETSPRNFQAWMKHERILENEEGTIAAKILAERFGGDPNSADWRHFGRLAGFTNPKEKYKLPNGRFPFSKVDFKNSEGKCYAQAKNIEQEIQQRILEGQAQLQKAQETYQRLQSLPDHQRKTKDYQHFQNMYGEGDRYKTDLSYALHCLQRNIPEHNIIQTIRTHTTTSAFVNRSQREQDLYIKRTLDKARRYAGQQPQLTQQHNLSYSR